MIQSIERAIDILDEISRRGDWVGVREVARAVGLKAPTVQQMLKTLLAKGFLEFNEERRQYRLGMRLWALAQKVDPVAGLASLIGPWVETVYREFGETVAAFALIRRRVHSVMWRQSTQQLAVIAPDERAPVERPHCLAGGRVVLAFSDRVILKSYIKTLSFPEKGSNLFASPEDIETEMDLIRSRGYAIVENVQDSGIGALAVPVFYANGEFVLALASSMPMNRFVSEKKDEVLKRLKDISENVKL